MISRSEKRGLIWSNLLESTALIKGLLITKSVVLKAGVTPIVAGGSILIVLVYFFSLKRDRSFPSLFSNVILIGGIMHSTAFSGFTY